MTDGSVTDLNREGRREVQRQGSGFKPDRKRYRLKWGQGHELHGFEVEMKGLATGTFLELAELADIDPTRFTADDMPKVRRLFEIVGDGLAEWNLLDEDDQLVPATLDGILGQDFDIVMAIADGWMTAIGQVPAPLDQRSTAGRLSEVASLPMDVE